MSVLAQCGYGRGNKIERGIDEGVIQGVVVSPRDESRERLESSIRLWKERYSHTTIIFDPQFYAAVLNDPRDGHLSEYDYYSNNKNLGRTHFSGSSIRNYVSECLNYQINTLGDFISYIVSPTILFDGFRDYWSQIALNMAVESMDNHANRSSVKPLIISIVVSETAFQNLEAMEEFLDALTELEVDGFYIIIRRNANSLQHAMEAASFGRLLYFCYVLADINDYNVIVGYSDWYSFLVKCVGVSYSACGWYQNLRQFSLARFRPSRGGRRPRKRYSTNKLLSSPLIIPELQDIYLLDMISHVLSSSPYDDILSNDPSSGERNWTDEISCLAHWFSLNSLSNQIGTQTDTLTRIQKATQIIENVRTLYTRLEELGVSFDPSTGPNHIDEWREGIRNFRGITGI